METMRSICSAFSPYPPWSAPEQALTQLKVIAETVLRPAPKGEDTTKHLRPGEAPLPEADKRGKTP